MKITAKLLSASLAVALGLAASQYSATDLGTLGGPPTLAFGLNGLGQVVGTAYTGTYGGGGAVCGNGQCPVNYAFLWTAGTMTNLGVPGGGLVSSAFGINDGGQVVGSFGYPGYFGAGFSYFDGVLTQITDASTGGSNAQAINASGQIVGSYPIGGGSYRAYRMTGGSLTDLGTLGGTNSQAYGINSTGQVVGWSQTGSGPQHAFLSDGVSMTDLGTLGGTNSQALGNNDLGYIVGFSQIASDSASHAFLYSSGQMIDLGTLGGTNSQADGIGNSGQIAGWTNTESGGQVAFLYANGIMTDLNTLVALPQGTSLLEATAINDLGQIVANGSDGHGYLLTPSGGTINVRTNLAAATFTIVGPATYVGGGASFTQTNAQPGTYTITFGAVAGYTAPPPQSLALSAGGDISFNGSYTDGNLVVCPALSPRCSQSISFSYQQGSGGVPSLSRNVSVSSTGGPLGFSVTASTTAGGPWLSVSPTSGTTPNVFTVLVAATLTAGTYAGQVTVASPTAANAPQSLTVTLTVTRRITLTNVRGWSKGGVVNAQWTGQPPGAPNSGQYYLDYAIDACESSTPCNGQNTPTGVPPDPVAEPVQWIFSGTGFCPPTGCPNHSGQIIFSDPNISAVVVPAANWKATSVTFTPSFTDTFNYPGVPGQPAVNPSPSVTIITPDGASSGPLALPSPGGIISTIADRGYGQCTWYVANQRLVHGLPIPVTAYYALGPIDYKYVPQQWDVIDFVYSNPHTAIIISAVTTTETQQPGGTLITYNFTIGEMNVGICSPPVPPGLQCAALPKGRCGVCPWSEQPSTTQSKFEVLVSPSGVRTVKQGILSLYSSTRTATAYFH